MLINDPDPFAVSLGKVVHSLSHRPDADKAFDEICNLHSLTPSAFFIGHSQQGYYLRDIAHIADAQKENLVQALISNILKKPYPLSTNFILFFFAVAKTVPHLKYRSLCTHLLQRFPPNSFLREHLLNFVNISKKKNSQSYLDIFYLSSWNYSRSQVRAHLYDTMNKIHSLSDRPQFDTALIQFLTSIITKSYHFSPEQCHETTKHINIIRQILHSELDLPIYLFGSKVSGLTQPDSDTDLVCLFPPNHPAMQEVVVTNHLGEEMLRSTQRELEIGLLERVNKGIRNKWGKSLGLKSFVIRATVPILKIELPDPRGKILHFDLSLNNPLGIINSKVIRNYLSFDLRCELFCKIIKVWYDKREIKKSPNGGLSSYALSLLCLTFLIHKKNPLLPNLLKPSRSYYTKYYRLFPQSLKRFKIPLDGGKRVLKVSYIEPVDQTVENIKILEAHHIRARLDATYLFSEETPWTTFSPSQIPECEQFINQKFYSSKIKNFLFEDEGYIYSPLYQNQTLLTLLHEFFQWFAVFFDHQFYFCDIINGFSPVLPSSLHIIDTLSPDPSYSLHINEQQQETVCRPDFITTTDASSHTPHSSSSPLTEEDGPWKFGFPVKCNRFDAQKECYDNYSENRTSCYPKNRNNLVIQDPFERERFFSFEDKSDASLAFEFNRAFFILSSRVSSYRDLNCCNVVSLLLSKADLYSPGMLTKCPFPPLVTFLRTILASSMAQYNERANGEERATDTLDDILGRIKKLELYEQNYVFNNATSPHHEKNSIFHQYIVSSNNWHYNALLGKKKIKLLP